MSEENNKSQNEKKPRRFNQQQYDLLRKCSDKKDITEWNEWRLRNPDKDVELEKADFRGSYLRNASFYKGSVKDLGDSEGIEFSGQVYLKEANFRKADLENARFDRSHLECADFYMSNIKGTDFGLSYLQGTSFKLAIAGSSTLFWEKDSTKEKVYACRIDKKTNFEGVPLDGIRIDPSTKQLLEYNIRRMNWEDWYKKHKILKWPVWLFWQMSDYGSSSMRIIGWFFGLAFVFAIIYRFWPGLVMVRGGADHLRDFIHALYFSVVTMTTLGLGDIAANPDSHCGQILLMIQVILGYVLLGVLITRLAVLFTGEGPAGKFADEKKKEGTDNGKERIS